MIQWLFFFNTVGFCFVSATVRSAREWKEWEASRAGRSDTGRRLWTVIWWWRHSLPTSSTGHCFTAVSSHHQLDERSSIGFRFSVCPWSRTGVLRRITARRRADRYDFVFPHTWKNRRSDCLGEIVSTSTVRREHLSPADRSIRSYDAGCTPADRTARSKRATRPRCAT